jgi:hypothetical protein
VRRWVEYKFLVNTPLKKKVSFWRIFQMLRRQMKPTRRRTRMTKCTMASDIMETFILRVLIYTRVHTFIAESIIARDGNLNPFKR